MKSEGMKKINLKTHFYIKSLHSFKTKFMKKIFGLLMAFVSVATIGLAQKNSTLNLANGQKYEVVNKISTNSSMEMQGQAMENKTDIATTYQIEVKSQDANNYNLSNTISNIKMVMSMMGQEMNFDSDKKEDMDGQMGSFLKDYVNKSKEVVIDKRGKIISDPSGDSASESPLANQMNFEETGYGSQFTFQALPHNLKTGTTWTDSSSLSGTKRSTTYTVKNISGNIATIVFTGTMSGETTVQQMGMEMKVKTNGTYSGEEKVDTKTGVIQSNTTAAETKGTVNAMGQEIPTSASINSATTVKLL